MISHGAYLREETHGIWNGEYLNLHEPIRALLMVATNHFEFPTLKRYWVFFVFFVIIALLMLNLQAFRP